LVIVPDGMKRAASLPSISAMRSCKAFTVGSSPKTSSPTSAAAMAARIAGVGRVTVSLRRSMGYKRVERGKWRVESKRQVYSVSRRGR
jgi:hypothetical protein